MTARGTGSGFRGPLTFPPALVGPAIMRLRRAFTIMEMLVVISIITLLISIMSPALSKAKEAANNTKCLANLSEIGNAITAYADDNSSFLPPYKTPYENLPKAYWGGLLAKGRYTDPGLPFDCPSYNPPRKLHLLADARDPEKNWFFTEYGINFMHIGSRIGQYGATKNGIGAAPAPPPTPRVTEIAKPGETIFVADSWGKIWADTANESGITFVGSSDGTSGTGSAHVRHMGNRGLNVLWGDTHASFVNCSLPRNPYMPDALTDADLSPTNNLWDIK